MANTLGNYDPIFYAQEALIQLEKALGMANTVHRGYDEERRSFRKGQTVSINRPGSFTAETAPASSAQDLQPDTVDITLNQWKEVIFALTDQELAYTQEKIIEDHIRPAAYALADNIDAALAALWYDVPWYVDGSADTTNYIAADDIVDARRVLFENKAPMRDPRFYCMLDGRSESVLLKAEKFSQQQGAGDQGIATQISGMLGPKYGFTIFANQNTPTQPTQASVADAAGTADGAHAIRATTLNVAAITASAVIQKGTIVSIAGHTQQYVTTANATADGTGDIALPIRGNSAYANGDLGLEAALSGGEVVTIHVDTSRVKQNLAYHRNAFAIAMAPLSELGDGRGAEIATITDPITGLSLRSRMWYEGKESKFYVGLDVLYGVKTLDSNLACRIRTAA